MDHKFIAPFKVGVFMANSKKSKHPLIGILISPRESRKEYLDLYAPCSSKLKIKLVIFTTKHINWEKKQITGLTLSNGKHIEKTFPLPNVIYNRLSTRNGNLMKKLEKYIGKNKCFNQTSKFSKWEIYGILDKSGFNKYLPDTFLYSDIDVIDLLQKYKTLYLKPSYGHLGKNVYKIYLNSIGEIQIYYHSVKAKEIYKNVDEFIKRVHNLVDNKEFIVQEEIKMAQLNRNNFDIRVLLQKKSSHSWDITNIVSRVTNKFFSNTSLFEKVELTENVLSQIHNIDKDRLLSELKSLSIEIGDNLEKVIGHLGEISVDYALTTDNSLKIVEVNGQPQKKIYKFLKDPIIIESVYTNPLRYALFLSKKS